MIGGLQGFHVERFISDVELLHVRDSEKFTDHVKRELAIQMAELYLKENPSAIVETVNREERGRTLKLTMYMLSEEQYHKILLGTHDRGVIQGERNVTKMLEGLHNE